MNPTYDITSLLPGAGLSSPVELEPGEAHTVVEQDKDQARGVHAHRGQQQDITDHLFYQHDFNNYLVSNIAQTHF